MAKTKMQIIFLATDKAGKFSRGEKGNCIPHGWGREQEPTPL
jgi:hypothetical protein